MPNSGALQAGPTFWRLVMARSASNCFPVSHASALTTAGTIEAEGNAANSSSRLAERRTKAAGTRDNL